MKKIYAIFMLCILGLTAVLSACGDPYKNMQMEVVTGDRVVIYLSEEPVDDSTDNGETGDSGQTDELEPNTAEVVARITGAEEGVSTQVNFVSGDRSKLQVASQETDGDTTTAIIRAISPGVVNLEAISQEGGLSQIIAVFIYRNVTGVEFASGYNPAVIANGEPTKIDETQVLFTPSDANVRELEYSLVGNPVGASIDGEGYLTVSNSELRQVTVRVSPVVRESDDVFAEITVEVLPSIDTSQLFLTSNFGEGGVSLEDAIRWIKNDPNTSLQTVSFSYYDLLFSEILRIRAIISDETKIVERESSRTNNSLTLSSLDTGTTSVTFEVYYAGHEDMVVLSKTVEYEVVEAVNYITANQGINTLTIFNASPTSSFRGTALAVTLRPSTASNLKYRLEIDEGYLQHLIIVNATGGSPFDAENRINSGTTIYITHDGEISNQEFTLRIVPAGDYICEPLEMQVTCLTSVESIITNQDTIMLGYSEALQVGTEAEIQYSVFPEDALKETVEVVSNDTSVATTYYDEDADTHRVVATGIGTATISFIVNGRVLRNITVECVAPYSTFLVDIDAPTDNPNVSGRTMVNVLDQTSGEVIGRTLESAVIRVGASIKINVNPYPTYSRLSNITYTIEAVEGNANLASVDNNGILRVESEVEQFKVIINAIGYTYDLSGSGEITEVQTTREVYFTAIMPITSISINTSSVEIYDINSVGIDEISQAQTRLYVNINPTNATLNTTDVVWTVTDEEFADLLEVQADGSVIITGRLTSGEERTFTVRAEIQEYSRVYSVECRVRIVRAKTVEQILLSNYDEARGVYMRSSAINGGYAGDTYQIRATAMPADAKNLNFKYYAFDINPIDESQDGWYWDETLYTRSDSTRIQVSDTGLITTMRGATGGYSVVWVVAADNIHSDPINFEEIRIKRVLLVYVADGTIENPYEISSYTDFINMSQAPDKAYRLVQTIDFASILNYAPIGTTDNPFTGSLTGKYTLSNGTTIINSITNFRYNANVTTSAYQGLFGVLGEGATISDLNITVMLNSLNVNMASDQIYSFGYIAGLNNGTISNVTVRFNGDLSVNNDGEGTVNIGGLVGENNGTIVNSRTITYNNFGINVLSANSRIYVGGLAGTNIGSITGQFIYVGDTLGGSSSDFEFNVNFNDETLNTSITIQANSANAMLGGITALNSGEINGAYSSATLRNVSYVGGITAINAGTIFSVRFTGSISANEYAGGIAGDNRQNASIIFGIVEICDDQIHYTNFSNADIIRYGGVVGNNSGSVEYSYINSYSAQRTLNNDNIDMSIEADNIVSFGAFVGVNAGTINKSFANVQINTNNLFYGTNSSQIINSYTLSYQGDFTTTNQLFYGGDGSDSNNFVIIATMNFGLPMIMIDKSVYNDKGDVLLTQSPVSIEVTVYGNLNTSNYGKDGSTNRYYKVTDTQLLLLLNNSLVSTDLNVNTYDLSQMFDIAITPSSERNKTILVTVIEGQDVLSVEGSTITVLSEGYAKLRFASDLDNAIYDDIEVYVANGITSMSVENIEEREQDSQIYRELRIQLGSSFNFNITNINSLTTGDTTTSYTPLQSGGYLFTFESPNVVEFDKAEAISDRSYMVRYADSQIITTLEAMSTNAVINPYVTATFYVDGEATTTNVVLNDVRYEFSLIIYRGLTDVLLQSSSDEIMPNTTLNYQVTLKTDLEESVLTSLRIYQGDITGEDTQDYESFDLTNVTLNSSTMTNFHKDISADSKFELDILNIEFSEENSEKVIVFEITPSKAINGETAILENVNYTLVFSATLGSGERITKQFKLTLKPQILTTILANHYNDGADFDSNLAGAGEEVSTRIIPGQYGLLIVNLWPEYSVFDRLEITSSVASNDVITFEQVYLNLDAYNYDTLVENTQIIENGISASRQSTKRFDTESNQYVYEFDGRIFLRTLTGTQVQTGDVFTITISAYNEGEARPYITQTLELTALQAPYLTFDFTNGRAYKGISHEYYAAEGTDFNFRMVTDASVNELTGITTSITDASGNIVEGARLTKSGETTISNGRQTINYVISANAAFEKGKEYYVEMVVTRNLNGVTTKARIVNVLHIVDFLVTGFSIVDAGLNENDANYVLVSNGLLSRPLSTEGWQIYIKLDVLASESNIRDRVNSIERQLNGIDRLMGTYYNPWKYMVLSGPNAGQFDTISSENVSDNFTLSNAEDGTGYRLVGNSIANIDTLMADFSYYYDASGNFTLTNDPTISVDGNPNTQFRLDFTLSSTQDHPLPITTRDEFLSMEEGIDYILLADIDLGTNYTPLDTAISSLDGNGYTITIDSFSLPIESSDTVYVGLFSQVNSGTLLKNVTVKFTNFQNINFSGYTNIYFGAIAGQNNGTITNAYVDYLDTYGNMSVEVTLEVPTSSQEGQTQAFIGGVVGDNEGIITNSRAEHMLMVASGTVGGFAGLNNGTISSSYVLDPTIQSSNGNTGGFVAVNNGSVNTSYVRGIYSTDNSEYRAIDSVLETVGQVGGFVYQNNGSISDSYANIRIVSQSRSAGFVYENARNGEIYNCLSLSDIIQNSIAHMPFVGTDSNDRFLNQGSMENAYFYQTDEDRFVAYDIDGTEDPAQKMTAADLALTSSLAGFAFSDTSSEFSGVWVLPSASYSYFNGNESFGTSQQTAGFSKLAFKIGIPELVAPNVIAKSVRRIESIETNETTGESIYNYIYATQTNSAVGEKAGYEYGTIHNQALINTVDDFVYLYEQYQNGALVTTSNINSRVINNIDFSNYDQTLNTSKVTLSGIIEGNGLAMNNISVVSNVDERYTEFGLFKSIQGSTSSGLIASIKNLTFSFIEVLASSSNIVGSVAGSMYNANLIDVEVQGNNVAVKGANIVGGVVGLVTGDSSLYHITTNISANSGYRDSGNNILEYTSYDGSNTLTVGTEEEGAQNILYVNDELFYGSPDETMADLVNSTPLKDTTNYVSYAGAVAGVIETKHEENIMECYLTPNIYDLTVDGNVRVIGATAGGVIGMAGLYTFVSNVTFVINQSSYISADDIAGGLIGELRGKLSQSSIIHTNQDTINNLNFGATNEDINLSLFRSNTTTKASGGLVGFNLGGTILDCISHAYVRNPYSNFAGGAVGITISGDIKAVIATGSVLGRTSVGGLIGGIIAANPTGMNNFYNYNLLPLYYNNEFNIDNTMEFDNDPDGTSSMVLSYVMAGNNWTTADQSTLSSIDNWGGLIGYYDSNLSRDYISTTHPQDENSDVNLINFYVAGNTDTTMLPTRGNEDTSEGDWMHIAEPIPFTSLTAENKQLYYGSYYRFVWDLTGDSKYPTINIQAVPETIEVASASDLLQIIWNLSGNYLIVDDIDLSSIDSWLPLGTTVEPFSGSVRAAVKVQDNSGVATKNSYYEIQNLKIVASNIQYVGLFGVTGFNYLTQKGAVFENLVITVEELVGRDFADNNDGSQNEAFIGALVADARGAQITNVVVTPASVNSMIVSSSEYTGGIVGRLSNLQTSVDVDEEDSSKGTIVIKSFIKNSLARIDIGVLTRNTNVNNAEISHVGGVVGQLMAGTMENTASDQTIALATSSIDENTGETIYSLITSESSKEEQDATNYVQSLYIGGLVGSNSSQNIPAGGNPEGGDQEVIIQRSFSNSEVDIVKLNLGQENSARADTYIGGFAGVLNEAIDVSSSFSTGKITTAITDSVNTDNITNQVVIGGFVGKVLLNNATSTEQIIDKCYTLNTVLDESSYAIVKGFGQIAFGDTDVTNNANATAVATDCYYEQYYALVIDYDENFGASSDEIRNIFGQFDEFSLNSDNVYYPVLVLDNDIELGIDDRENAYVVYGLSRGSKLNPILIDSESSLMNVSESANNNEDYLYFLVTQDINNISTHVMTPQGDIVSNNSPMINSFNGFLNGNGFSVRGFTIKETPKTFDADYEVVEDNSGIENAGLVRVLRKGSYISGLSLDDVYIDYQSSSIIQNSTINVGALVGTMEDGSAVFASTVSGDIFVKGAQTTVINDGVESVTSMNQTLNIGGIVGYANGGSIINSANYARIASFDYLDYKNIAGQNNPAFDTINAGGLVGKMENGASLLSVFSISQFNFVNLDENNVYTSNLNYGSIAGYAHNSVLRDWYAKVDLVEHEYDKAVNVSTRIGYEVSSSGGTNSNIIEEENVQVLSSTSDLSMNYGYEYAPLLENGVPRTQVSGLLNGDDEQTTYYLAGNTESLLYLLQNNYNIALANDLYVSNIVTVDSYSGQINGQYNAIYGIDNVLVNNVNVASSAEDTEYARIENIAFSGSPTYNGAQNTVFGTLGSSVVVSTVDLKTTSNTLGLARNKNAGIRIEDVNSDVADEKNQLNASKWMNLSVTDDANASQLRPFVEYWDETDVRGVYLNQVEATFTVTNVDEDGNITTSQETEMRYRINDAYQLAKFAMLMNDNDTLDLETVELNHNSTFDLGGKIWNSLVNYEYSLVSSSELEDEKAVITNMYAEGTLNVGFIGSYNASDGRLFNLEFRNAKLVEYPVSDETTTSQYFGVVAGSANSGTIDSVTVSGILNINVPNASYVGTVFGTTRTTLNKVKAEGTAEDVAQSKVVGLDLVGGISGYVTVAGGAVTYIDNNYNITGRDFVGGYFGYATGTRAPAISGFEHTVIDGANQNIYHKNAGNIQGRNFVGGLIGYTDNVSLNSTRNEGSVSASGYAVGGIAGFTASQITNTQNSQQENSASVVYNNLITSSTRPAVNLAESARTAFEERALVSTKNGEEIIIGLSSTTVQPGYFYGGFVGYLDGADIRSTVPEEENTSDQTRNINWASVKGISFVGGIAGFNNTGNIYGNNIYLEQIDTNTLGIRSYNSVEGNTFVGGIAGLNYSTADGNGIIKDAIVQIGNDDNIAGEYCVGGIVGANFGYVWSVAAQGAMSGQTTNMGGIVGYNAKDIQYANSAMGVTLVANNTNMTTTNGITCVAGKNYYVGGIVGHNAEGATLQKSVYTRAQGTAVTENLNGVVQFVTYTDESSFDLVFTFSDVYVGGLVGVNDGSIQQSYVDNKTTVQFSDGEGQQYGDNHYIAGFVGYNTSTGIIKDSYSLAKVQRYYNTKTQGVYVITDVSTDPSVGGGLVYRNDGSIESSYARYSLSVVNNGDISDDCYVMNSQTTTITEEVDNGDGTTTPVSTEVTQLEVDEDYRDEYSNFISNKLTLSEVEVTNVNCDFSIGGGLAGTATYARGGISMKFISKDGTFADTEVLINNYQIDVSIDDGTWYNNNMRCECEGGSECNCSSLGCCETCECRGLQLGYRSDDCLVTHAKKILENFESDNSYFTYLHEHIFTNVVFNLAFTGLTTPSNGTASSPVIPEEDVQTQPSTLPSTGFLGSGTAADPYRIYTIDDIETLNRQLMFGNTYSGIWFILMNDLDLSGENGVTIGTNEYPFQGYFNGNNKTISNNHIRESGDNIGFFPTLPASAQVINLTFLDCTSEGNNNVGIVAGYSRGTINGVKVYSSSNSNSSVTGTENIGGIAGYVGSTALVTKCSVGANINGQSNVGGIVGLLENGDVTMSEAVLTQYISSNFIINKTFSVNGNDNVGGIVGQQTGYSIISECSNETSVVTSQLGGGIVGYSSAESAIEDIYVISDVVNRGNVQGGVSGQIAGELGSQANNVLALGANTNLLGNGSERDKLLNCYDHSDTTVDTIWQVNGLKRDFYSTLDFIETWGMSATQLDISTNLYSYPTLSESGLTNINDNYPRLMNLNSSEFLIGEYSFFVDQYFNVDDITSTSPTMYIETELQFNILINYFLGRYLVAPPSESSSEYDSYSIFMAQVMENPQYRYSRATYRLYKTAVQTLGSTGQGYAYNDSVTYSSWTALPSLNYKSIDFNGITINIGTLNNEYSITDSADTYAGFFSVFNGYADANYDGELGLSQDKISNLNLVVGSIQSARYVGCIVANLQNGTVENCSVTYNGQLVSYLGSYGSDSAAGIIAGLIAEPRGEASLRGSPTSSDYAHGKIVNCSYTSALGENTFKLREENGTDGFGSVNYHTNY